MAAAGANLRSDLQPARPWCLSDAAHGGCAGDMRYYKDFSKSSGAREWQVTRARRERT
jgi:hypothetical protein